MKSSKGKAEADFGAFPNFTFKRDSSPVLFHNLENDAESETVAAFESRVKRLEDPLLFFFAHADAAILKKYLAEVRRTLSGC